MGNFLPCTPTKRLAGKGTRVILPDGGVRQVTMPATAAELMLDAPGHFLADARAARAGARLSALAADEDLELGTVYATFPMKRLGKHLLAADMARLASAATRDARRSAAKASTAVAAAALVAKVSAVIAAAPPAETAVVVMEATTPSSRARLDEMVDDAVAAEISVLKLRLRNTRSRRPTLETIQE